MRSRFAVLVLLLASSCGDEPPPAPEHEDTPRVQARIEALLPHLRAELGEVAIRDDSLVVVDGKELLRRAAAECSYAETVFGPSTDEDRDGTWLLSTHFSPTVITDEGVFLQAYLPRDDARLDAHLIHGLVQAHLVHGLDLGAFRSGPADMEDALVRHAALEAFTRSVGRRVAERAGVTEAYALYDRGPTPTFGLDEVESGWELAVRAAVAGDRYLRDAGDTFATRLIDRHGLDGAVEKLFEHPPTSVGTLLDPDGRTLVTPRDEIGDVVRACLAHEMVCDPLRPLFRPTLEVLLLFAAPGRKRKALDAWVSGARLAAMDAKGDYRSSVKIRLVIAKDPAGAKAVLRAWVESVRGLDAKWKASTPRHHRLDSVRSTTIPEGTLFERVEDQGMGIPWPRPQQMLFWQGEVVVEITIYHPASVDTDAPALARRVRAALHADGIGPAAPDANRSEKDPSWELRWTVAADRSRDESQDKTDRARLLLPLLGDPDPRVRMRACRRIGDLDHGGDVIPWETLRPLLSDPDAGVRAAAFSCLTVYRMPRAIRDGTVAPDAFPLADVRDGEGPPLEVAKALIAGLVDPDGEVRYRIADALEALGPRAPKVADAFRRALTDKSASVREAALQSLTDLEPPLPDLVDLVVPHLDKEEAMVRVSAIRALSRYRSLPQEWRDRIHALIDDDDAWVRTAAARALGELGKGSEEVIAALLRRLDDENLEVRNACRSALRELGVKPPKPKPR